MLEALFAFVVIMGIIIATTAILGYAKEIVEFIKQYGLILLAIVAIICILYTLTL